VANTISVIDMSTMKKVQEFTALGGPDCMEVSADGKTLMFTSRWMKRVSMVDIASGRLLAQIAVGRSPHGVYFAEHAARR